MRRRSQDERGQSSTEHLGILVLAIALILALFALAPRIGTSLDQVLTTIIGADDSSSSSSLPRGGLASLRELAAQARADGDLVVADQLDAQLRLYDGLIAGGRGQVLGDLVAPNDAEFADLVRLGTIYSADSTTNRRYLQLPPTSGDGIIVHDFFIRQDRSLFLEGDDRDGQDPLLSDLDLTDSRFMLIVDRETGRAVLVQSESCTVSAFGGPFCNEPRPISVDLGDNWENDSENDVTGEGLNLDESNQFELSGDDDSLRLSYDALNSITPLIVSADGTIGLQRGDDGNYEIVEDTRDNYPAQVIYQYRPGRSPYEISDDPGQGAVGAVPQCDLPDLPALPFGGPDLPDLSTVPGPCF